MQNLHLNRVHIPKQLYIYYFCNGLLLRALLVNIRIFVSAMMLHKHHINQKLPVLIEADEDGTFIFSCPTFQGCHTYGETMEEGMRNIQEVIEMCVEEEASQHSNNFVELRELEGSV